MLRLTLDRVGDGQAKTIGTAVIGRWSGRHITAVTVDWGGPKVGAVDDHDPAEGVWTLVRDALTACLDGEAELTDQQLAALERALQERDGGGGSWERPDGGGA